MKRIVIILILIIFPLRVGAISASSYIVMDTDNNRVLEGNNINKESLIASITKILTSMVVINNIDLDKKINVSDSVLKSSTENFAYLMNLLAKNIGMKHSNFVNSSGLEEKDSANTSTVYDMALLSSYAIKNPEYQKIVSTKDITVKTNLKSYIWHNKNKLLTSYKYCTGGKTGYTKKAKRTLVTNASKNNVNLTVVTFNDGNDFNDHKDLYEKYFNTLKNYKIITKGRIKTDYDNTFIDRDYDNNATNIVGSLTVSLNGKEYFKENIYIKEPKKVKELKWYQKLIKMLFKKEYYD